MRHFAFSTLTPLVVAFSLVPAAVPFTPPGAAHASSPARRVAQQPRPAPPARRGLAGALTTDAAHEASDAQRLSADGPQFPQQFGSSNFTLKAFVRGGWPLFIAYELGRPGVVKLHISFVNFKYCPPYNHTFGGRQAGYYEEMFSLPVKYADETLVAAYSVRAMTDETPTARPVPLRLYAIGAGPRAVGSSGFNEVRFGPDTIVLHRRERASYSFRAIRDFPLVNADFMRVSQESDGGYLFELVGRKPHGRVVNNNIITDGWDCLLRGEASVGLHELWVRGQHPEEEGGDWMVTTSAPQRVDVR